jgi:hypothetical protein
MSSRQKRKQARRNGAMAAGTKSPQGIQTSSMNAIKHGLTAKTLVLSTESQAEFDEMLLSYTRKFQPQDEVEMDLVNEMVAAQWRLRRIWLIQTTALDSQMEIMEDNLGKAFTTMANEQRSLELLLRYETTYRRMYDRALSNLLKLRESFPFEELRNDPEPVEHTTAPPSIEDTPAAQQPTSGIENCETTPFAETKRVVYRIDGPNGSLKLKE